MARRRRRRKLKTWIYFPMIAIVLALGTLIFVWLGKGGLPEAVAQITPTPNPEETTVAPTPTPIPAAARMFPYYNDPNWGYKDEKGEVRIDPDYINAQTFSQGYAFVSMQVNNGTRYKMIDTEGNNVTDAIFDDARPFKNGYAAVKSGQFWGFINTQGVVVIEPNYVSVGDFSGGFARFSKDGLWGYIGDDPAQNPLIDAKYNSAQDFNEDGSLALVGYKNADNSMSYWIIDSAGTEGTMIGKTEGSVFSQGVAAVKLSDGTYAFYDKTGKNTFGDKTFEGAKNFSEDLAAVKTQGKWGYIDLTGETKIPAIYDDAEPFSDGLAAVKKGTKWGAVAPNTQEIIAFEYDTINPYENGYTLATIGTSVYSLSSVGSKTELYLMPENAVSNQEGTIVVSTGNLNVRETASTTAAIRTIVANGTKITILDSEGDWYHIRLNSNGVEGYVKKEYVKLDF